ncbi:MAG: Hsp70 family protein [Clostridiales bacterium]|nr:Hsp70 family protein [Clostridiales bacterium]
MAAERIIGIDFGTSTSVIRVKRYINGMPEGCDRMATKQVVFNGTYPTVPTAIQRVSENTYYGYDALIPKKKARLFQGFKVKLESAEEKDRLEARALTKEFFSYLAKIYLEQSNRDHLGQPDDHEMTIISYPVKWKEETKAFMRRTVAEAGFPNVEGVDEAQAAIHAVTLQSEDYLQKQGYLVNGKTCTILLIDMGAGTTDLVLCRYTPGQQPKNEILCTWPTEGGILFGGQETEQILSDYVRKKLPRESADLVMSRCGREKFKAWKENIVSPALKRNEKVEDFNEVDMIVELLELDMEDLCLDRAAFEAEAREYLQSFPRLVQGCIEKAGIDTNEVELVILTGGHSQWYFTKEMLCGGMPDICGDLLPKIKAEPGRVIPIPRPQETVALGLVYGPISTEHDIIKTEKPEETLAAENSGERNKEDRKKDFSGLENSSGKNVRRVAGTFTNDVRAEKGIIGYYRENADTLITINSEGSIVAVTDNGEAITLLDNGGIAVKRFSEGEQGVLGLHTVFSYEGRVRDIITIKKDGSLGMSAGKPQLSEWKNIVAMDSCADGWERMYYIGLHKDGTVSACGNNKYGQCDASWWENVKQISCNLKHVAGLLKDGTVITAGDNSYGKCNVNDWRNVVSIATGREWTFGLHENGTVLIAGSDKYGMRSEVEKWTSVCKIEYQDYFGKLIGLKTDGTVYVAGQRAKDWGGMLEWHDIISVSCGKYGMPLGLTSDGRVLSINNVSSVSSWRDVVAVYAGKRYSVGIKRDERFVCTTDKKNSNARVTEKRLFDVNGLQLSSK